MLLEYLMTMKDRARWAQQWPTGLNVHSRCMRLANLALALVLLELQCTLAHTQVPALDSSLL